MVVKAAKILIPVEIGKRAALVEVTGEIASQRDKTFKVSIPES
jgi:hypothetical protein